MKMTSKEIEELREKVYGMSSSWLPLDKFFNDIRDNKSPDFNKELAYKDLTLIVNYIDEREGWVEKLGEAIEIIKEFVTIEKIDGYEGDFITQDYSSSRRLPKEKADLLKEVFANENSNND